MQKSMRDRNRYLLKNTVLFAIGNFGTKFISFFMVPLYTNCLATDEYGTVDLITTLVTVLMPILTLNVAEAVIRFCMDKDSEMDNVINVGMLTIVITSLAGLVCIPVFSCFSITAEYSVFIYLYTFSTGLSVTMLGALRGKEQLLQYSIGNIIQTALIAVLNIIFLVVFKEGVSGYLKAYIYANLLSALYAFGVGRLWKSFRHLRLRLDLAKKMLKFSIVLIPNTFMWWIMNSSDRIMVTSMISNDANGLYAISYKIPTILSALSTVFINAWGFSAIKENDSEDRDEFITQTYSKVLQITVIIAALLLVFLKPILRVYVNPSYYDSWKYTPYLLVGFVFMTMGRFVGTPYYVNKDSLGYVKSGGLGAALNIILNLLLIPLMGVAGAALATCFSYIIVYLYRVIDTKKYCSIDCKKRTDLVSMCILLACALTEYIDSFVGTLLLLVEFCTLILLQRELVLSAVKLAINRLHRKRDSRGDSTDNSL